MSNYVMELSKNQLQTISLACEVCARLKTGQVKAALSLLELLDIKGQPVDAYELSKVVEPIIKAAMKLEPNASWGVGYNEKVDSLYDIHDVIKHRLAWDEAYDKGIVSEGESRKWPEMMAVDYDEPMQYSLESLPTLTRKEPTTLVVF